MAGAELFGKEELKEVMDVMETGILMKYGFDKERKGVFKVQQFEQEYANYLGAGYALGVTSGSAALKVALAALDVGPGDEVIVPPFTFIATYEAVLEVGAVPIVGDIDESLNLDPDSIEKRISPYTKAVIPVHMCGAPSRIDKIVEIAKKHNLKVLEDNAQSAGGSFRGKKLGTFGDMGILSFDYYKTMTTGEGGMVLTNSKELYLRADWYHDHGHDHNPKIARALEGRFILGFNFRMNELQGALGLAQLRKLDTIIAEQRKNKAAVRKALSVVPGIQFRQHSRPRGRHGHLHRLQPPLGGDHKEVPEGHVGKRRRPHLLLRELLALPAQLGALHRQVHGLFRKVPLCGPLLQGEGGVRPGDVPEGGGNPPADAFHGHSREDGG